MREAGGVGRDPETHERYAREQGTFSLTSEVLFVIFGSAPISMDDTPDADSAILTLTADEIVTLGSIIRASQVSQ